MPQPTPAASVQGISIRVTRLNDEGELLGGPYDSFTTSAFIRVSFTPEYEDGEEITEKAADGTLCISYKAPSTLKRMNLEVAVCNPDPELTNLLSGGLLLSGQDTNNNEVAKGWASALVGEDPSGNGVAIEVWSRAIINGKPVSGTPYFHWVFPMVKARLSGDRVIENGLLATTFEGFGEGNINFRSGPDQSWQWPAAVDRPYLYAYSAWAPQGLNGFYTWTPAVTPGLATESAPAPLSYAPSPGTNTLKATDPYPYRDDFDVDQIVSVRDYTPDDSGEYTYPHPADEGTVQNAPSSADVVQNAVTYAQRVQPVEVTVSQVVPADPQITASDAANAQKLYYKGYTPAAGVEPWEPGESFTVGTFEFHWDGGAWAPGEVPA